jgi:hypothetical protein
MEKFRLFLTITNAILYKCNHDTDHPDWLQFRFNVAGGLYRNRDGVEWDNRLRKEKA